MISRFFKSTQDWAKKSPWQAGLTGIGLVGLLFILYPLFSWLVLNADFVGQDRSDCHGTGACWIFIRQRWVQFVFGFFPEAELWRPSLVGVLWGLFLLPLLKPSFPKRLWVLAISFVVLPLLSWAILNGALFHLPVVETSQWGGLFLTILISSVGIVLSLPMGIILALGRRSELPFLRWSSVVFIEFWRGVPLIAVLFMASVMLPLFLPPGVEVDKLLRVLVGVCFFTAAYMAEVLRGGLQSVPKGQYEAAASLNLKYPQTMALVILPQALRLSIPSIVNTFIGLFKDTSLVLVVGMFDLLGMVQAASTDPEWLGFAPEGYVFAGFIFWFFCFAMSRYSLRLEKSLAVQGAKF